MNRDMLPYCYPQKQLHLEAQTTQTESRTYCRQQSKSSRFTRFSCASRGSEQSEPKTCLVDISEKSHHDMKYKSSKGFVLIHVVQCVYVNVHVSRLCVCVWMRVPTVHFRQVFALVDSAAATFITASENVMR